MAHPERARQEGAQVARRPSSLYLPAVPVSDQPGCPGLPAGSLRLRQVAAELYDDLRLAVVLRQLLAHSGRLLGVDAGSVSLVDADAGTYRKVAERGASCRLGASFPLEDGVTGRVVAARAPVVLDRYGDVPSAHLPVADPAYAGSVVAVPIWWRGAVLGANVAFAGRRRHFTATEVDELEVLSQVGAAGLVVAGATGAPLAVRLRDQTGRGSAADAGVRLVVTEAGLARPTRPAVTRAVVELVGLACSEVVAGVDEAAGPPLAEPGLRVALLYGATGLRLLVHQESPQPWEGGGGLAADVRRWRAVVAPAGGAVEVEHVPGWGVLVRADLPYDEQVCPHPLTAREHEVLALLARGLGDRNIAERLVLSRKTVEKHVGAVLRKTGTTSRTAAVVTALQRGWLPPVTASRGG